MCRFIRVVCLGGTLLGSWRRCDLMVLVIYGLFKICQLRSVSWYHGSELLFISDEYSLPFQLNTKWGGLTSPTVLRSPAVTECVQLFAAPWTAAHQAFLSFTIFTSDAPRSLSQWCQPTIPSSVAPFASCPQSFPASGSFPMMQCSLHQAATVLEHQYLQWIFRVNFL